MARLRAKICSIFGFSSDENLILRYVDEDGDLVTLADDDDLHDVMRQQLKFLRIDVHINNDSCGKSNAGSSGSATPLEPPPVRNPFLSRDAIASYPLPEPVREALSKLSISKAASSSPLVDNLALSILKMGQALLNTSFQPRDEAGTSSKSGVPEEHVTSETIGTNSPNVDSASKQVEAGNVTRGPNYSSTQINSLSSGSFIECPFSGTYIPPHLRNSHIPPFKRSHSHTEAMTGMFHKGVRCDGCGVYPITGPRFKSKVKENYDLCNICFNEMGNRTDYIRMDHPASSRGPPCVYGHTNNIATLPPHIFKKGAILKHGRPKLDSQFILDVNVIDGTMMAPSTAFTKIWRMRNNGSMMWPKGTQLVWTGGDTFSYSCSIDLEVPEDGVPVGKELDIAVDFTAPQLPGQYTSYWRMATRSGHKFGQRVWVSIQVDASLKDSFYDSSQGMNLNIPLDVSGCKGPQVIDINVQPIEDDTFLQTSIPNAPIEPVNQMVDMEPRLGLENESPTNEATFVGPAASAPATSVAPSSVSYPIIDLAERALAVPPNQQSSNVDVTSTSLGIGGIPTSVEESLLKDLAEMGFKEVDLNKEVLRKNDYDLEQSLDDLCSVDVSVISEWDPILEELQEMGFRDKEMNKRLLKKNNGSIKRVVMDLINGE
uniref:Next to BRCA1 gene 1 protein n=1 Tax=Cajanus cajan TaxID=3821 RepID=A0A151TT14_CAJCA|nr:hypothetical protein KK1_009430 [Cajanus cajan]